MTTTLGNCQYSIDEVSPYTVHIWGFHNSDINGSEWILQPHNPKNISEPWASVAEAETWAIGIIQDMENLPTSPTPTPVDTTPVDTTPVN